MDIIFLFARSVEKFFSRHHIFARRSLHIPLYPLKQKDQFLLQFHHSFSVCTLPPLCTIYQTYPVFETDLVCCLVSVWFLFTITLVSHNGYKTHHCNVQVSWCRPDAMRFGVSLAPLFFPNYYYVLSSRRTDRYSHPHEFLLVKTNR